MTRTKEFRIEYSSTKTLFMGLFGLVFSLIFLLVGTIPFLLFVDKTLMAEYGALEKVVFAFFPIVVWPCAYALFILSIRHFNNIRLDLPLAVFTKSGVSGFTPLGTPISIEWDKINRWELQASLGNIILWDKNKIDSIGLKLVSFFIPVWNPKSVSIPLIYGREKYQVVMKTMITFNPHAEKMFEYRDHTGKLANTDNSISNYMEQDQVLNGLYADVKFLKFLKFRLVILTILVLTWMVCLRFFPDFIFENHPENIPRAFYMYPLLIYFLILVIVCFRIFLKNKNIQKTSKEIL